MVHGHFWKRLWNLTIFGRRCGTWPFLKDIAIFGRGCGTWPFLEEVLVRGHVWKRL